MPDVLAEIRRSGQRLWVGNIDRRLIQDGSLKNYIECGLVTGVSVSPESMRCALLDDQVYDNAILKKLDEECFGERLASGLILEDVRYAADLLRPVFDRTDGADGWALLPISPLLIADNETLADEILALQELVKRPNTLISVSGCPSNLPAIEKLVYQGIALNLTCIYSPVQYTLAAGAYLRGIEQRIGAGIRSVVPTFISISLARLTDAFTNESRVEENKKVGIDAHRMAEQIYKTMRSMHTSERWECTYSAGARPLRLIWDNQQAKAMTSLSNHVAAPFTIALLPIEVMTGPASRPAQPLQVLAENGGSREVLTSGRPQKEVFEPIAGRLQEQEFEDQITIWIDLLDRMASKCASLMQANSLS